MAEDYQSWATQRQANPLHHPPNPPIKNLETLYFALQLHHPNDNSPTTPSPCPQIDPASMA